MHQRATIALLLAGGLLLGMTGCGKRVAPAFTVVGATSAPAAEETPQRLPPGGTFRFPRDEGGAALSKLLPPHFEGNVQPEQRRQARQLPGARALERPDLIVALPLALPDLPHGAGVKPPRPLQPRMTARRVPLEGRTAEAVARNAIQLPTTALVSVRAVDVDVLPAMPFLSQALSDRAPLEDPTAALSLEAVLATKAPERTSAAPPQFLNLPDPFENRHVVRLRGTPPEDSTPVRP